MSTRKPKISPDFPCQCGHPKKVHGWAGLTIGDEWCNFVIIKNKKWEQICQCEFYAPDNLKYLELCYKKRGTKS